MFLGVSPVSPAIVDSQNSCVRADLTCTNAGKTIRFEAGEKTVIQSFGQLTFTGTSGEYLTLTSTVASAWELILQPNAMQSVEYVAVAYSDASDGQTISAPTGQDDGNNENWNFSSGDLLTWTGDVDTDWNNTNNWDTATVPISLDTVMIPVVVSGKYPILAAKGVCTSLKLVPYVVVCLASCGPEHL